MNIKKMNKGLDFLRGKYGAKQGEITLKDGHCFVGLIDEFVDCIRNHKTPLINLKWHKETIQSMLGCYESIKSGKIAKVGK